LVRRNTTRRRTCACRQSLERVAGVRIDARRGVQLAAVGSRDERAARQVQYGAPRRQELWIAESKEVVAHGLEFGAAALRARHAAQ
jgi:hypothetical protein